jgi:hypothetical protein
VGAADLALGTALLDVAGCDFTQASSGAGLEVAMRDQTQEAAEARLNRLLNYILETSVDVLGFDAVTVTTRHDGAMSTVAATDQRLIVVDEAQYHANDGPCVEVLDPHDPIVMKDARTERRWPAFVETARHFGVEASLSLHVPVAIDDVAASMNFYARHPMQIPDAMIESAKGQSTQVADAMTTVQAYKATAAVAHGLSEAMKSRATIEQAKGILMAEKNVTADDAFEMLTSMSQHANIKLRDIAARIVHDRTTIAKDAAIESDSR